MSPVVLEQSTTRFAAHHVRTFTHFRSATQFYLFEAPLVQKGHVACSSNRARAAENNATIHSDCWFSGLQYLEVVWELRAAGVAWVHGDANIAVAVELQLRALKDEALLLLLHRADNAQNLWNKDIVSVSQDMNQLATRNPRNTAQLQRIILSKMRVSSLHKSRRSTGQNTTFLPAVPRRTTPPVRYG